MALHTDDTIRRELQMTTEAIEAAGVEDGRGSRREPMQQPYGTARRHCGC